MQVGAFSVREAACLRVAQITTLITVLYKDGEKFYIFWSVSWLSDNMPIVLVASGRGQRHTMQLVETLHGRLIIASWSPSTIKLYALYVQLSAM